MEYAQSKKAKQKTNRGEIRDKSESRETRQRRERERRERREREREYTQNLKKT